MGALSHRKHVSAGTLKSTFPLHFNLPYFIDKSLKYLPPASNQTTSTPSENISQHCLSVLARNVDSSHKLNLSVCYTNNHTY